MMTFCTLFNVNYLDKGLVLFDSLENNAPNSILYVLAMDDKCYEVLSDINKPNLIPIRLKDFESDELLRVKPTRKLGEYYWTCSAWLISYVLDTFQPDYCTYLDADLYIYSDPEVIIQEMKEKNASVQVVNHHFHPLVSEDTSRIVGKYCVEFDTFKNDEQGRQLLEVWKKQVIEHCSIDGDGVYWGDQKYQDNWVDDYSYVIATDNVGAGVAPWNITQYKWMDRKNNSIVIKRWGKKAPLLFYHFENITYINESMVDTSLLCSWGIDKAFIDRLYVPYLTKIREVKQILKEKYGVDILIKSHPGVAQEKIRRENFLKRLVILIQERRVLHSLMLNLCISLPSVLFKNKRYISF